MNLVQLLTVAKYRTEGSGLMCPPNGGFAWKAQCEENSRGTGFFLLEP